MTSKYVLQPDINEFGSHETSKADNYGKIVKLLQTIYGVSVKGE